MMLRKKSARVGAIAVAIFAAIGFSEDYVTATVPVTIGADALVTISPPSADAGIGDQKTVSANVTAEFTLQINEAYASVSRDAAMRMNGGAAVRNSRGNVTLDLSARQYANAAISLHSLNGRRVLSGKASAAGGTANIARRNVAAGVYLLLVKGAGGSSFSTRLTHRGGNMNINAAFGDGDLSIGKQAASASYGNWTVTVKAFGNTLSDSSFVIAPVPGTNDPIPAIVLREKTGGGEMTLAERFESYGISGGFTANVKGTLVNEEHNEDETFMILSTSMTWLDSDEESFDNVVEWLKVNGYVGEVQTIQGISFFDAAQIDADANASVAFVPDGAMFKRASPSAGKAGALNMEINGKLRDRDCWRVMMKAGVPDGATEGWPSASWEGFAYGTIPPPNLFGTVPLGYVASYDNQYIWIMQNYYCDDALSGFWTEEQVASVQKQFGSKDDWEVAVNNWIWLQIRYIGGCKGSGCIGQ